MTQVVVNPGICGMRTTIEAIELNARKVRLTIESECKTIRDVSTSLMELDLFEAIKPSVDSVVYKQFSKCRAHASCPVPMAVIKAIEVEAGMALPKSVSIDFVSSKQGCK